eukprot:jgi/Bigna1/79064/fgenesh1_pg.59_\
MMFLSRATWLLVLINCSVVAQQAPSQCYLEDANADCAMCWITDPQGVQVSLVQCPTNEIDAFWMPNFPETLYAGETFSVDYALQVGSGVEVIPAINSEDDEYGLGGNLAFEIPHANIHSCISSRGACTPFVTNTPGLSTHTEEKQGNLTVDETGVSTIRFTSEISLPEEEYVIIAHFRFLRPLLINGNKVKSIGMEDGFVFNCTESSGGFCLNQYDVAIGVTRTVATRMPTVALNAYVYASAVAMVMAIIIVSFCYAYKRGKIDIDKIVAVVFNEVVVTSLNFLSDLVSVICYTITYVTVVLQDEALVSIIPIGLLFTVSGWISLLVFFYVAVKHLETHKRKKLNADLYHKEVVQKITTASPRVSIVEERKSTGNDFSVGEPYPIQTIAEHKPACVENTAQTLEGRTLVNSYIKSTRRFEILVANGLGILLRDGPIAGSTFYILILQSNASKDVMTLMLTSLLLSGIGIGYMGARVSEIVSHRKQLRQIADQLRGFTRRNAGTKAAALSRLDDSQMASGINSKGTPEIIGRKIRYIPRAKVDLISPRRSARRTSTEMTYSTPRQSPAVPLRPCPSTLTFAD